ncbi:unnamed protein product [Urochloa humidicola]
MPTEAWEKNAGVSQSITLILALSCVSRPVAAAVDPDRRSLTLQIRCLSVTILSFIPISSALFPVSGAGSILLSPILLSLLLLLEGVELPSPLCSAQLPSRCQWFLVSSLCRFM